MVRVSDTWVAGGYKHECETSLVGEDILISQPSVSVSPTCKRSLGVADGSILVFGRKAVWVL